MTLPNQSITPIPNNEPDAVPSLWNVRYQEIDENFASLDQRQTSTENEIEAARAGGDSLAETINAIITQVGGISGTLNGLASPTSVQNAVTLDWLYRNRRIAFELFAAGYNLQNHLGVSVIAGIMGDDSLDVADTSGVKVGEDYLLSDATDTAMVRITAIHSGTRLRLAANLSRNWGATAKLTGSTLVARPEGGVDAAIGAQWVSKAINLGDDNTSRAVVIRRSLNAGEARLYFRDAYTTAWTERSWSVRRSGGGTSGVPEGFADYEYVIPMRGDGYMRLVVDGEAMVIKHVVALGGGTGQGGYVNPLMRPNAPTISSPASGATNVIETPTLTASNYVSPAGNAFATAQFQISTSSTFASILHDSGEKSAMTYSAPSGVLAVNTLFYVRARVKDVAGLASDWATITSFTTKATYAYVNTPTVTTPTNGQTEIPEQPTLQSSAFTTTGGADTHASSQWQIRTAAGTWAAPLHDSGASTTNKTSYTVPTGVLVAGQTQYVMRVRHTGTSLGASEWSSDIAFTTKQQFAQIIGIVCTATGGGAGTWQRVDENFAAITTTAATFNNHPTYAGVVAQTIDGQAMMKVPKYYLKTGTVPSGTYAGKRYWMISDQPVSGFTAHPAFMNAGVAIDQFWVGKYQGTTDGTKLGSVAGLMPLVSIDFPTMQTRATNRNTGGVTGFGLWNIYQLSAIQTLALIEMGGSDSQALIGQGYVSGSSALAVDNATVAQATWRGIVGLWGNVWQMVDGLRTNESSQYEIWDKNGNKTWVNTGVTAPADGYPVTFATASGASFDLGLLMLPQTSNASAANGTTGDCFWRAANCVAYHGGGWSYGPDAGLFSLYVYNAASYSYSPIGGRLAKV
ncbi:Ig-like domain-containing protein [Azonexus hydrophilus]|uniref:Ig-like domain-containing protein n=1 Tax=Azonexus hydrophilus TaxID=418702 RepID=UPI0024904B53|nr:Ig-like domain-containing protein [Azonexus hydrophilus]